MWIVALQVQCRDVGLLKDYSGLQANSKGAQL